MSRLSPVVRLTVALVHKGESCGPNVVIAFIRIQVNNTIHVTNYRHIIHIRFFNKINISDTKYFEETLSRSLHISSPAATTCRKWLCFPYITLFRTVLVLMSLWIYLLTFETNWWNNNSCKILILCEQSGMYIAMTKHMHQIYMWPTFSLLIFTD